MEQTSHISRKVLRMVLPLVILLVAVQLSAMQGCPNHQHDFREEGFSVVTISVHSSLKWVTKNKSKFLGITVSSSRDQGAVEISKRVWIQSTVTVCSKCRMATGMVFMALDQLKQVAAMQPALQPLLSKAIAAQ